MKKRIVVSVLLTLIVFVAVLMIPGVGTKRVKAWNGYGDGTDENPWNLGGTKAVYNSDTKVLTISGTSRISPYYMERKYSSYSGYYYSSHDAFSGIRGDVKEIVIKGATKIYSKRDYSSDIGGNIVDVDYTDEQLSAFKNMTNLEKVTIEGSLTIIPSYAFSGCTKLKQVVLSDSVENIDSYAFSGCESLETITNESNLKKVQFGVGSFMNCKSLEKVPDILIPEDNSRIPSDAFNGCENITEINLEDNVVTIGGSAFKNCSKLEYIYLPESECTIRAYAFSGCNSLKSVVIPNTKYTINTYAFSGCTSLEEIRLSEKSTYIDNYTFENCTSLKKVVIPNSFTSVDQYAFQNCTSLQEVQIGNGVKTIGDYAFRNCTSLEKVTFPSSLETIGYGAFSGCNKLTEVDLSNQTNLSSIGTEAFYNCSSVNKVKLPQGVNMTIGGSAFRYATSLKSITFPSNVTSIGMYAFSNRNNLETITFEGTNTTFTDYALGSGIEANFNVPLGSEDDYKQKLLTAGIIRSDGNSIINNHQHAYDQEIANDVFLKSAATCSQAAVYYKSCGCGEYDNTQTFTSGTALPHDWDEGRVILEPTEDTEGTMFYYCQRTGCRETKTEKINKLEHVHSFVIEKVDNKYLKSAATCVSAAVYYKSCRCGQAGNRATFTSGSKTDKHTWDKGTITKEPTTTKEGVKTYKCKVKGCTATKTEPIPKKTAQDVSKEKIQQFVSRLYTDCLGRQADNSGVTYWSDELANGNTNGASVGAGFVFSEEYMNKGVSKKDYVKMLYKVFMGREADESGMNYWLDNMANGMTREEVFKGFVDSKEYTQICADYGIVRGDYEIRGIADPTVTNGTITTEITSFVERIYVKALNRESDPSGINYWAQEIANESKSPVEVAELFIFSEEFESKNLNDTEYIKVLYRTFMGREFDNDGLNYWLGQLASGKSRKDVLESFAGCPEFQDIIKSFGL